jgi:hypothetical protein
VIVLFKHALTLQKERKYLIQGVILFLLFIIIYTVVDSLNMSYSEMSLTFGRYLVILNISLNIFMAFLGALLMNLSTAMVELKGKEGFASNFGALSVLFGILTYGCTTCVIAFFASIGIAFSVIALPLAGFPYKLLALLLLFIGLFFMYREIEYGKCKVNLKESK